MMKRILLALSFFPLSTLILILLILLSIIVISQGTNRPQQVMEFAFTNMSSTQDVGKQVQTVKQFLAQYGSPLEKYADYIVEVSNTYGIDFRLIPAIAMQESNLCKKAPIDSNNCWGYGIYGGKVRYFSNYKEGIETVAFSLSQNYVKKGYTTVDQIMSKYTPRNTNDWVTAVSHFMAQMEILSSSF